MNWDDVQTEAKRKGWLVFAMDQGQTYVMAQHSPYVPAYKGYCFGLAVAWIALRYAGSDFAYDSKTLEFDDTDWDAVEDQSIYEHTARTGEYPFGPLVTEDFAPAFAKYGLTLNKGRVTNQNSVATGSMLRAAGSAGTGCYFICMFNLNAGHAIAIQNEGGGRWRLFDPNHGSLHVNSDTEFEKLIDWYIDKAQYDITLSRVTKIVGVNPPPYVNAGFEQTMKDLIKKLGLGN
jgi:hypothetical protein